MNLQNKVYALLEQQLGVWQDATERYRKLNSVRIKLFGIDNSIIRLQFNPARAVSTQAKLDRQSIMERPCFLCHKNRPTIQQGIDFKGKYEILLNPYPILSQHFTITSKQHEAQQIEGKIDDMLDLAFALPDFVVFYNGARAGASAPDHFHFQAGNADFFHQPIEMPMENLMRKYSFTSPEKADVKHWFETICKELCDADFPEKEAKMNLFCQWKNDAFVMTVFPRKCHRPSQYFAENDAERILLSPGAIDMTGTLIVTREEDFEKLTAEIIKDIYQQIS